MSHFDSMSKKSAWAALATLGITAVAAGTTAFIKYRKKRRQQAETEALEHQLSADQEMVYNEAVRSFLSINDRIYELRQQRMALQPLIEWLATDGEKPEIKTDDEKRAAAERRHTEVPHHTSALHQCLHQHHV